MKLSLMLPETQIIADFQPKGTGKQVILEQMVDHLWKCSSLSSEQIPKEDILNRLLERESEQTTAIGDGFAFPHARMNRIKGTYLLLALAPQGVAFEAMDGKPCTTFILLIVPRQDPTVLLQARATTVRFLLQYEGGKKLFGLSSGDIWRKISDANLQTEAQIFAQDVMHPIKGALRFNMTLTEAASELHRYHVDSLPILNDKDEFIRDFSCYDLFSFGLPQFFSTLHQISFIRYMNPFEKYFQVDRDTTLANAISPRPIPVISPDTTLMEIVFEMTTHNRDILYVVNDQKKLLGLIDRYTIVDKILIGTIKGDSNE